MISENIMIGLSNVLQLPSLIGVIVGTALGLFIGAMPGLSATMGIALLLPPTYG